MGKPIVVAVNGVAAGAGANFALQGDIVLAAKSAQFIQAFVKIGLAPDCGGTWSLTRLIGEARAKALALTGEPLLGRKGGGMGADLEGRRRRGADDRSEEPTPTASPPARPPRSRRSSG